MKLLSTLLVTLLLSACGDSSSQLRPLKSDATILAFGDSLTEGYSVNKDDSYPAQLAKLTNRNIINAGISGEVSEIGLSRLPGLLAKHEPELVIICHGGNDILRKQSMAEMQSNLTKMITLAKNAGADVILMAVPNFGLFLSSHETYIKIADETGVVFMEDLIPDILSDKSLKSDTVHPNKLGYQLMADTIYDVLKSKGAL